MASLKDIRMRIESTKNTQQITKAMKMVSAAKLRRAQNNIVNMRPYARGLLQLIADVAVIERVEHPLLAHRENVKKVLLVVITSDRGLCGAFNTNINKFAENYYKDNKKNHEQIDFLLVGRKAIDYFTKRKVQSIDNITKLDKDISYELAAKVAEKLMNVYLENHYDEIRLIYNEFKSAISQAVVCETLLPVDLEKQSFGEQKASSFAADMILEPNSRDVFDKLLARHFAAQVYRCMSESVAAEHGARMTSMENATNNAKEMLNNLTLTYNKLRQEKITTELIEIISGAEAL